MKKQFQTLLFWSLLGCGSDEGVKAYNSEPVASITSHQDGAVLEEDRLTIFKGSVSDANDLSADLKVTWYSDARELCPETLASADGSVSCQATLDSTESELRLQVVDPEGSADIHAISVSVLATQAPSAVILSPTAGTGYFIDQLILFKAILDDNEDDPSQLSYQWESSIDGLLPISGPVESSGEIEGHWVLSVGQHAIYLTVQDSEGKLSVESVVIDVLGENHAPICEITQPQDADTSTIGESVIFQGSAVDPDLSSMETLAVSWHSDKDGELGPGVINADGEVVFVYSDLSPNQHLISMSVDDGAGESCTDSITFYVGNLPFLNILSPADGSVHTFNAEILFEALLSDADGGLENINVEWLSDLDGVFSNHGADSAGNISFLESGLSGGEHNIVVTATDDQGFSCAESLSLRINNPPSEPVVSLTPVVPVEQLDQLICSLDSPATDIDGDPLNHAISWTVDGQPWTGNTGSTVLPDDTIFAADLVAGQIWECAITANDGFTDGSSGQSNTVTVQPDNNCDPNFNGALLIPSSGFCDPNPPSGWVQCAGWINTSGDDVSDNVLDGCLNPNGRLRIRVWDSNGTLEEDVYSTNANLNLWPSWNYLGGSITKNAWTYWSGNTDYFVASSGGSACYFNQDCGADAPCGTMTLGTGNGSSVILAPGWHDEREYKVNCSGQALNNRSIAVYY